jgi:hypothetical protein
VITAQKKEWYKTLKILGISFGICAILVSIALISLAVKGLINEIDWSLYTQISYIGLTIVPPLVVYPFYSVLIGRSNRKKKFMERKEPKKFRCFFIFGVLVYLSSVIFITLGRTSIQT